MDPRRNAVYMASLLLLACLVPSVPLHAQDSGERGHPADSATVCMDREVSTATGGCITREDGTSRDRPPATLSPPDTSRESPPGSQATSPEEGPAAAAESP